ncbi:unnamed protein product [Moneuplotes crassus]|uniref:Uncharacterized protein n=1 Tax=Euplotes crassus TaxID=5936 RepID=A0AAD1UIT7_EUPCR|nr:unnamed protein product [Moneuplotes crassus]
MKKNFSQINLQVTEYKKNLGQIQVENQCDKNLVSGLYNLSENFGNDSEDKTIFKLSTPIKIPVQSFMMREDSKPVRLGQSYLKESIKSRRMSADTVKAIPSTQNPYCLSKHLQDWKKEHSKEMVDQKKKRMSMESFKLLSQKIKSSQTTKNAINKVKQELSKFQRLRNREIIYSKNNSAKFTSSKRLNSSIAPYQERPGKNSLSKSGSKEENKFLINCNVTKLSNMITQSSKLVNKKNKAVFIPKHSLNSQSKDNKPEISKQGVASMKKLQKELSANHHGRDISCIYRRLKKNKYKRTSILNLDTSSQPNIFHTNKHQNFFNVNTETQQSLIEKSSGSISNYSRDKFDPITRMRENKYQSCISPNAKLTKSQVMGKLMNETQPLRSRSINKYQKFYQRNSRCFRLTNGFCTQQADSSNKYNFLTPL